MTDELHPLERTHALATTMLLLIRLRHGVSDEDAAAFARRAMDIGAAAEAGDPKARAFLMAAEGALAASVTASTAARNGDTLH